jgi:hypothetical protein
LSVQLIQVLIGGTADLAGLQRALRRANLRLIGCVSTLRLVKLRLVTARGRTVRETGRSCRARHARAACAGAGSAGSRADPTGRCAARACPRPACSGATTGACSASSSSSAACLSEGGACEYRAEYYACYPKSAASRCASMKTPLHDKSSTGCVLMPVQDVSRPLGEIAAAHDVPAGAGRVLKNGPRA